MPTNYNFSSRFLLINLQQQISCWAILYELHVSNLWRRSTYITNHIAGHTTFMNAFKACKYHKSCSRVYNIMEARITSHWFILNEIASLMVYSKPNFFRFNHWMLLNWNDSWHYIEKVVAEGAPTLCMKLTFKAQI